MKRRELLKLASIGLMGLALEARARGFVSPSMETTIMAWEASLRELAKSVRKGSLSPSEWQNEMEALYGDLSLSDLLEAIRFEELTKSITYPTNQSAIAPVILPSGVSGLASKLFCNRKGTAVIPHVHNNMVSAHLVVKGRFRVRTFQRDFEAESPGELVLDPGLDTVFDAGQLLTMSDDRHNGHWLEALDEPSITLDVPITDLPKPKTYRNPGNRYSMIFCDPTVGKRNGRIYAPIIGFETALEKFGKF